MSSKPKERDRKFLRKQKQVRQDYMISQYEQEIRHVPKKEKGEKK